MRRLGDIGDFAADRANPLVKILTVRTVELKWLP